MKVHLENQGNGVMKNAREYMELIFVVFNMIQLIIDTHFQVTIMLPYCSVQHS